MDALKLSLPETEHAALPAEYKPLYQRQGDGSYKLGAPKAAPPEAPRVNEYEGLDPKEAREAVALKRKLEEKNLLEKGDYEAVFERRTREAAQAEAKKTEAAEKRAREAEEALAAQLRDAALTKAAIDSGVVKSAVDDVLRAGKEVFLVRGGKLYARTEKGETDSLAPSDWLKDQLKAKPHWLAQSSGAGTPPNAPNGSSKGPAGSKAGMSDREKAKYIKENGFEAYSKLS